MYFNWLYYNCIPSRNPMGWRRLCPEQAVSQFVIMPACFGQTYTDKRMAWAVLKFVWIHIYGSIHIHTPFLESCLLSFDCQFCITWQARDLCQFYTMSPCIPLYIPQYTTFIPQYPWVINFLFLSCLSLSMWFGKQVNS